ncbi:MAG TPA: tetratricopeptide repeat protein, partial [Balneolales bacterium]|nr:tetratricopeptide repeat protein [Balneolales bacterium]
NVDNNNAYGLLLLRRGAVRESEQFFRCAVDTIISRNPNPYKSEPYYNLALSLFLQGRYDEAYDLFYKCTWNDQWKSVAFFYLARIDSIRKNYEQALEHVDESLISNSRNNHAWNLKAAVLRKTGRMQLAHETVTYVLNADPLDYGAMNEQRLCIQSAGKQKSADNISGSLKDCLSRDVTNYLALAEEYMNAGMFEEVCDILEFALETEKWNNDPMIHYYLGYCEYRFGHKKEAVKLIKRAGKLPSDFCFPNRLKSIDVLKLAQELNPDDARAPYYLGNLFYDKKRYDSAIEYWEKSRCLDNTFPTVHRNLAIAYYNKKGDAEKARVAMEAAFALNTNDARVFFELDQLYKKQGKSPEERLKMLNDHLALVEQRDDLYLERVMLYNLQGNYRKAAELLATRHFHPWEGGEGKVTGQYVLSHVQLGREYLGNGDYVKTIDELKEAQVYPENLGEGKLTGTRENNIHYYLACAYEEMGEDEMAGFHLNKAVEGDYSPSMSMYYYDKASDMIFYQGQALLKMGKEKEARSKFNKLIDYGQAHLFDKVSIDYFAISLPDFLVFDEDLDTRNKINCHYLMGLGYLGLRELKKARDKFCKVLELDVNHIQSRVYLSLMDRVKEKEEVLIF